jgi:outer membrane receptor protein involved in Fe transport
VELDLAGQITDRLSTIASYAYTDAKTTEDPLYAGNQLANVAKNTPPSRRSMIWAGSRAGAACASVADRAMSGAARGFGQQLLPAQLCRGRRLHHL